MTTKNEATSGSHISFEAPVALYFKLHLAFLSLKTRVDKCYMNYADGDRKHAMFKQHPLIADAHLT